MVKLASLDLPRDEEVLFRSFALVLAIDVENMSDADVLNILHEMDKLTE